MSTFTDMVAAVVLHSSVAAYSHFGLTLEPVQAEAPAPPVVERTAERTVERTSPRKAQKTSECIIPRLKVEKA
jgi:hypothetical protein